MRFRDYFNNDFETSDNHSEKELRTRYYRARTEDAINAVKSLSDKIGFRVTGETGVGEVCVESYRYFATITCVETHPYEVAIDIKLITNHGIFDFGRGIKYIKEIYDNLDKTLQLKGVGLFR